MESSVLETKGNNSTMKKGGWVDNDFYKAFYILSCI